eukprot:TRINITY_DN14928_c0_g1_i3.p3 TRINITY_DN14928_c0_g1~~TRINITY_DN14928_c0_g1_i3.p3  ORF type:complete len:112 (-),score=18.82 TRINITY_DN14928_c0_g1_i3:384-719(-)
MGCGASAAPVEPAAPEKEAPAAAPEAPAVSHKPRKRSNSFSHTARTVRATANTTNVGRRLSAGQSPYGTGSQSWKGPVRKGSASKKGAAGAAKKGATKKLPKKSPRPQWED